MWDIPPVVGSLGIFLGFPIFLDLTFSPFPLTIEFQNVISFFPVFSSSSKKKKKIKIRLTVDCVNSAVSC